MVKEFDTVKAGFVALSPNGYKPQAGDVAVIQTAPGPAERKARRGV